MNKIMVFGRVSQDPTVKDFNGRNVANFGLAANTKRKDKEGKYGVNFYNVSAWGATADVASKFLKKGHRVVVCGDLETRNYVKQDGTNGTSLDINNAEIELVETKAEAEAKAAAGGAPAAAVPQGFTPVETQQDELPF